MKVIPQAVRNIFFLLLQLFHECLEFSDESKRRLHNHPVLSAYSRDIPEPTDSLSTKYGNGT